MPLPIRRVCFEYAALRCLPGFQSRLRFLLCSARSREGRNIVPCPVLVVHARLRVVVDLVAPRSGNRSLAAPGTRMVLSESLHAGLIGLVDMLMRDCGYQCAYVS